MPPPYVAIQGVKPAQKGPILAPSQVNERHREIIAPQQAPDPPRYGDTPARPARMPMYSVLAMKAIRSVMAEGQSGVMGKTEFQQFTSSPRGKSLAFDNRANISRTFPEPFGSRFSITPQVAANYRIRAEMGV